MTANAMQQDKDKSLAAGMNDHLAKPIDPDELFSALLKWIKSDSNKLETSESSKKVQVPEIQYDTGIPMIDGLDYKQGLKRVLGKTDRYLQLLEKYILSQERLLEELKTAFLQHDTKLAERLAHTSKSLNGNIGAIKLQEIAADLEKLFRENSDPEKTKSQFHLYASELLAMLNVIKQSIPVTISVSSLNAGDLSKAEATEILAQLKYLLANDDSSAIDYFEAHLEKFRLLLGNAIFNKFSNSIKSYDFEASLCMLDATRFDVD